MVRERRDSNSHARTSDNSMAGGNISQDFN